jgi:hypothetical protein
MDSQPRANVMLLADQRLLFGHFCFGGETTIRGLSAAHTPWYRNDSHDQRAFVLNF